MKCIKAVALLLPFVAAPTASAIQSMPLARAIEIANSHRVRTPIPLAGFARHWPAPGMRYGQAPVVADSLGMAGTPKQPKAGLIQQDTISKEFAALKSTIKTGGT